MRHAFGPFLYTLTSTEWFKCSNLPTWIRTRSPDVESSSVSYDTCEQRGHVFFFYQSVARWFLATGSRTPAIFSRCNWFAHHQNFIPSPVKNLHQSAAAVQSFPVFCASQYIKMWELHWMSPAFCLLVLHTSLHFSLFGLTDIHFGSGGVLNYWRSVPFSAILLFCCRQSTRKACVPPVKHCSDQK